MVFKEDSQTPAQVDRTLVRRALARLLERTVETRGIRRGNRIGKSMTGKDPYNLRRFLEPQTRCIDEVYKELGNGHKVSHWMWFIFPQLKGLGRSPMSNLYGISSLEEAQAYLAHPVLGPRLSHCTSLVLAVNAKSIEQILGDPDDLKFRSSMTLFAEASTEDQRFRNALEKYFGGKSDPLTIKRLSGQR